MPFRLGTPQHSRLGAVTKCVSASMQRQSTKIEILPCLPTTQPIITVQPFRMPAPPLPSPRCSWGRCVCGNKYTPPLPGRPHGGSWSGWAAIGTAMLDCTSALELFDPSLPATFCGATGTLQSAKLLAPGARVVFWHRYWRLGFASQHDVHAL